MGTSPFGRWVGPKRDGERSFTPVHSHLAVPLHVTRLALYSFKTPADQHVDNTGDTLLLPAPKGFQAGAEPVVNDDEKCSVM